MANFKVLFCFFIFSLSFHANSMSAWDKNNRPENMSYSYKRTFKSLPLSAELPHQLWSGDYWPSYMGGITYRWNHKELSKDSDRYSYRFLSPSELENFDLSKLSPSEKYDLYRGDYDFTLSRYERGRTQIMKTVKGSPSYIEKFKIPEWEGLCHAWAPATIHYKNPGPATVIGARGHVIPFGSSDIKALLTYNIHINENPGVVFLGSRCNLDFSKLEEKLKKGEISEEEYENKITTAECKDTNAGAFHIALANQIGLQKESFIIDITRDQEVWNQAVQRYSSEVLEVSEGASEGAAPGTVREILVETKLDYITEVPHSWTNEITEDVLESEEYSYWLEIDKRGKIIGGDWVSFERPDFIWNQGVTPFTGFFEDFALIYQRSIGGKGPSKLNKWRKVSRKLGKNQLLKKRFVGELRDRILRKKLDKALKMAKLKVKFLNKMNEIRKEKKRRALAKKLKQAVQTVGKKKSVISHLEGELLKTKFRKDVKKAVLVNKYTSKLKKEALKTKFKRDVLRSLYLRQVLSSWKGEVVQRNFYNNSRKLSNVHKFGKKLNSEVLKSRLKRKITGIVKAKDFGDGLKRKVVERNWRDSTGLVLKKKEVVGAFKGTLIEKDLRDSFNKYKNAKTFGQNLKDKVKEKKSFYKNFLKVIANNNQNVFYTKYHLFDLKYENRRKQNALMVASKYSRVDFVEHILENGGKDLINKTDKFGKNSLSILLYQLSKDVSRLDSHNQKEIVINRAFEVVKVLVKNGIDVNKVDNNGKKPRYYARLIRKITRKYTKVIDKFLKKNGGKRF